MMPRKAALRSIKDETHDTKTFTFEFVDGGQKGLEFKAGQFVMLSILGFGEAAISIATDLDDTSCIDLTIREVGAVTGALFNMREGGIVGIRGPYGNSWPLEEAEGKRLLVVSGGCGCGTLKPVITNHVNHPGRFRSLEALYGARTPGDIIYRTEYEDVWPKAPDTRVLLSSDRVPPGESWGHTVGMVVALFDEMVTRPEGSVALICGPEIMMKYASLGLIKRGFSPDQIYCSMERRMRCGLGQCGHCQLGAKYVCRDGPIFSYAELARLPDHIVRGD